MESIVQTLQYITLFVIFKMRRYAFLLVTWIFATLIEYIVARYILVKISRVKENLKMESSREMIQLSGPGRKFMIELTKMITQKDMTNLIFYSIH